jgi:hypothetical protein
MPGDGRKSCDWHLRDKIIPIAVSRIARSVRQRNLEMKLWRYELDDLGYRHKVLGSFNATPS